MSICADRHRPLAVDPAVGVSGIICGERIEESTSHCLEHLAGQSVSLCASQAHHFLVVFPEPYDNSLKCPSGVRTAEQSMSCGIVSNELSVDVADVFGEEESCIRRKNEPSSVKQLTERLHAVLGLA